MKLQKRRSVLCRLCSVELLIIILSADTAEWSIVRKKSTNLQSRQFNVAYKGSERSH